MDAALKMALSPSPEDEVPRSNRENVGLSVGNLGLPAGLSNGVQQNGHLNPTCTASPFEQMGISLQEQPKANQFGRKRGLDEISDVLVDSSDFQSVLQRNALSSTAQDPTRKRSSRRLPCKARGMGESHTPANAYFDIPHDLQHGAVLACSHHACSGSGRRFRYCRVCEVPVAKRNFQKRHSHGISPVGDPSVSWFNNRETFADADNDDEEDEAEDRDAKHRRSVSYDAADTLNQLCAARKPVDSDKMTANNSLDIKNVADETKEVSVKLSPQELQWLSLFHNRPSVHDTKGMEKWMTNIIDVSESAANTQTKHLLNESPFLASLESRHPRQEQTEPVKEAITTQTAATASLDLALSADNASVKTSPLAPHEHQFQLQIPCANGANSCGDKSSAMPPVSTKDTNESSVLGIVSASKVDHMMLPPSLPKDHLVDVKSPMFQDCVDSFTGSTDKDPFKEGKQGHAVVNSLSLPFNAPDRNARPQTLADFAAKRVAEAASHVAVGDSLKPKELDAVDEEQSQASSVITHPALRRRRSVQDARQLMGLIKLSSLNEKEFDDIF